MKSLKTITWYLKDASIPVVTAVDTTVKKARAKLPAKTQALIAKHCTHFTWEGRATAPHA